MAIALVTGQKTSAAFGVATGGTLTLTNNPTTGNFVVVGISITVGVGSNVSGCTVVDSNSNSYAQATISPSQNGISQESVLLFYLANAPANASKSIVIAGLPSSDVNAWTAEFSGVLAASPYDTGQKHTTTTSSTNINDPAMTPANNGSLMIAVACAGQSISVATSPWTLIDLARNGNAAEYYIQPTAGSQAIGFTQSPTGDWTSLVAAFKPTAGGVNTLAASNLTAGSPVLPTPTFIFGLQLGDYVLDNGLSGFDTVCDKIYICTQQPTTFTEAVATFAIGNKNWGAGNAFGAPAAGTGGRQITSVAITNGSVTANGTPAAWAAVDSANSQLLASGNMTGAIAVTNGQVFTLSALTFLIPNT